MDLRRRQGRHSQIRRPLDHRRAHVPYAVGEDVGDDLGAPVGRAQSTAHGRSVRMRRQPSPPSMTASFTAGDETLALEETQQARWRRPGPIRAALAKVGRASRAGARTVAHASGAARKRISLGAALSFGVPLTLLLALLLWLTTGSYWQARAVRIQGTSDPALLALVHAQRLTGCNVFRCDFSAARESIAASPQVQQVSVTVVYPDTTLVDITQRQTVALWRTQSQTWAVGADGVIIGAVGQTPALASASAAVVEDVGGVAFSGRAPHPGMRMSATLVTMARQLLMKATGAGLDPTALRYSAQDGFTLRANGGALVIFGGPADALATLVSESAAMPAPAFTVAQPSTAQISQGAQLQVEAATAILAQVAQGHASATLIDVRWGAHPYYR